jgi:diguanylate cyclase (GGDEF)-like protein
MNLKNINYITVALCINGLLISMLDYMIERIIPSRFIAWIIFTVFMIVTGYIQGLAARKLFKQAYTDHLTGMGNRGYFDRKIKSTIKKVLNKEMVVSMAMLDIDHFKSINDTFGHQEGDLLLKEISSIMKQNVRRYDEVIRWGGDEFAIVIPNTSIDSAVDIAERIRQAVEKKYCGRKVCYNITVSIGVVCIDNCTSVTNVITLADKALYEAKKSRNIVVKI